MRASVLGAGGYLGGELLRLLSGHPVFTIGDATSSRYAGRRVSTVNPNLRGVTDAMFVQPDALGDCDVLFSAVPHGVAMKVLPELVNRADVVIDLSADFRLRDRQLFADTYGVAHAAEHLLDEFVAGIPELTADQLRTADRIAMPGCMANAAILALLPIASAGLLAGRVTVDGRTGSSGAGSRPTAATHHATRAGALRVYRPGTHRHRHEIAQTIGVPVEMTATAVAAVRGVQVVCYATLREPLDARQLRQLYRRHYRTAPFVRISAGTGHGGGLPEVGPLAGTNFCDIGVAVGAVPDRVVVVAALDNLVKGGAGNAIQCANLRLGIDERAGLGFTGLFPV
jgi:N-acetyl-gamma-glutamyl-phosphate/LysW-gamma-L-alpha-aminoadipyl-6-phosphate reductase